MKQPKPKQESAANERDSTLDELRAMRRARRETNQRIEQLKVTLLRMSEHNIEQAVRLLRRWLRDD